MDEDHNKLEKRAKRYCHRWEYDLADVKTKTEIITYWLKIVCITIVMIVVLARWKHQDRLDKKLEGRVVLDSERKKSRRKGH